MTIKLLYVVSHAIQYQAPLLKQLAGQPEITLRVVFEKSAGDFDPGFNREITWDVPLLEGYDNALLTDTDLAREIAACDVLWLHGWQTPVMRRALILAKRSGKPVLMRGENCQLAMPDGQGVRGMIKRRYLHRIFRRCSAFLSIGSDNEKYYLARGVTTDQIFPTPYAIDNDRFTSGAEAARSGRADYKRSLGLDPDRPVILYAGKLMARKCPDLLVRAVSQAEFGSPSPQLVFVGDGDMRGTLQVQAPEAVFLGFRNQRELPALYDMADVFVLPSFREPWGLAVNEAMACSTPVVVSDQVGCAVDLVGENSGAIFPAGDADSLAKALVDVLKNSTAMGRAAKTRLESWGFDQDIAGIKAAIDHVMKATDHG